MLLHLEEEVYFGVNTVGARIWSLLPPECEDIEVLCDRLGDAYPDVGRDTLRADVQEFLDLLASSGLVISRAPDGS